MKIVKKSAAEKFTNSSTCFGTEAVFNDAPMNGALITVKGRYPENGYAMNKVCKELVFVVKGGGAVHMPTETIEFSAGDTIYLDSNDAYFWDGDMELYAVCTPAFYPEQHTILPFETGTK